MLNDGMVTNGDEGLPPNYYQLVLEKYYSFFLLSLMPKIPKIILVAPKYLFSRHFLSLICVFDF